MQDNLNTHNPASLYEAFTPLQARRLVERFEWHYAPKYEDRTLRADYPISSLNRLPR